MNENRSSEDRTVPGATTPQAPTDAPIGAPVPSDGRSNKRGTRKRVLGDGEGDYCIYEISGADSKLPKGTLVPIPTVPRFEDSQKALRWIRNESGDLLAGKQVMIFRACEILSLQVQSRATVVINTKPKVAIAKGPETSNG